MATAHPIRIGTAGWSIPKLSAPAFPVEGTHLERTARVMPMTEVNSSFYRPHKPETWARWAASTPLGFRFAVKLPKAISHEARLVGTEAALDRFLAEAGMLGDRFGPLLVQLPPSLRFDRGVAEDFFALLRARFDGDVVCEPRHASWFTDAAEALLAAHRVARVAADPAPVPGAGEPGGWDGMRYWRLHGSPVIYRSAYEPAVLDALAEKLSAEAALRPVWCVFDNTADFHAVDDALATMARLGMEPPVAQR
ncbi:hypothetical protein TSH7_02860 [Azospirillum sp. TSH7]|uniref:DUF72 domain-containing protein n=1 Tax=unclassified Azospirillum TaxID=2630922 RepID=UPI000D60BAEB|nr:MULTISPECIES: DUF72 domain-containing protein [unclassified Azospirillum]PWC67036.1 hypothetical protein TSH20_13520 [Azospirillum sp. TSH20]PWC68173.1 hypothetical protein TSH7_02860 [Azospirillum sp. TSH7]QCG97954.1 DUF72 domain-containing protein [Azospirillum sp. TSA2s]